MPENAPFIVVADDEDVIREVLERRLKAAGYRVETAEDGEVAVDILQRADFVNVLVTDLRMPRLDGLALLRRAKELSPDTEVIVMTAYGSTESASEAVRLGAFDYLQKPFERSDEVLHKVKAALRQQGLVFQNREMMRQLEEARAALGRLVPSCSVERAELDERVQKLREKTSARLKKLDSKLAEISTIVDTIGGEAAGIERQDKRGAPAVTAAIRDRLAAGRSLLAEACAVLADSSEDSNGPKDQAAS